MEFDCCFEAHPEHVFYPFTLCFPTLRFDTFGEFGSVHYGVCSRSRYKQVQSRQAHDDDDTDKHAGWAVLQARDPETRLEVGEIGHGLYDRHESLIDFNSFGCLHE